ncbi:MAG: hypothetical protein RQ899_05975 [Pseudomonadales bacterium]|nr:hypothetical protein [Pseudomonadales bacterium]
MSGPCLFHTLRIAAVLLLAPLPSLSQAQPPNAIPNLVCDRECLFERVDRYLEGLVSKDPSRVPWAEHVRFTENNVALRVGDGIWGTIEGLGDYDLRVADVDAGEVAFFGEVIEPAFSSLMAMRLKVENRLIAEVEMVILRTVYEPKSIIWPAAVLEHKPLFQALLPAAQRRPRERLIAIADGYFDTLQLNDGTLFTAFHEDCNRVENGTLTTHNPAVEFTAVGALGCEEQFRQGNYRYDDRLRARRFPLVDVERGLVLAAGFIDHAGKLDEYTLSDGTRVDSPIRFPHSFYLLELFRIEDGKIRQVEAVFVTVPYGMPSPWDGNWPQELPSMLGDY